MQNAKKKLLSCFLCMTLLFGLASSAFAAVRYIPTHCDQCGAALQTGTTSLGHYTDSHLAETGYVDINNQPIYANCSRSHTRTLVGKYCSTHGTKWTGVWHEEYHSYCGDKSHWE